MTSLLEKIDGVAINIPPTMMVGAWNVSEVLRDAAKAIRQLHPGAQEQYHSDAMRTAAGPEIFHYPKDNEDRAVTDDQFFCDVVEFLDAAAVLDEWKSRLFYGKEKTSTLRDVLDPHEPWSLLGIGNPQLTHAILGLATEGAEATLDLMKLATPKGVSDPEHNRSVTDNMLRELGDISWYKELAAHALNVPVSEIQRRNIDRLRKRFPDKFSESDALARADEA